jgi:signal transduction histidine kinase
VALRDEFLSIASHELSTPLTSLKLMVQGLVSGALAPTPVVIQRTLGLAERQIRRLGRLIDELVDASRIEAGRLSLQLEAVDLAELVRDTCLRYADDLGRARSALALDASQPVVGEWDRGRLEHVVSNLLSNAIKFGAGGPIEVSLQHDPQRAVLRVRDRGIGIPPERIARIFDRYERAVSSRQYGGLGLGLYITRTSVESLGGTVHVDSTPGQGSLFTVELPRQPPGVRSAMDAGGASEYAPQVDS